MKICTDCKTNKSLSDFGLNKTRKDGRQGICKTCMNSRQKVNYRKNPQAHWEKSKVSSARIVSARKQFVWDYLTLHPCVTCGETDPVVLEFDHRDGTKKSFSLGEASSGNFALSTVISELEKCDVRCANCHRRKTYRERGMSHRDQI